MISLPKLLLTVLVVVAVFMGVRWLRRGASAGLPARRRRTPRDAVIDLERNPETGAYEPRVERRDGDRRG